MDTGTPDQILHRWGGSQGKKIRVVAKIRGGLPSPEPQLATRVSVQGDASQTAAVTFVNHHQPPSSYEVNCCYEQHLGNDVIFQREIKTLISGIFNGVNATVIASGAKGSGKTYLIQGKNEEPGLAMMTVAHMLDTIEGTENFIEISSYEATSDNVYDLLGPSRNEVHVMGDARRNIQLRGLSRVLVTSMPEFLKLFGSEGGKCKPMQKAMVETPRMSHRGLMIHLLSKGNKLVGKMNFVVLAGYEAPRRKGIDGPFLAESTKINKSINSLHNVLYCLSKNETHIPYREMKLTHMLQDSLGGASKILMVACLSPSFCQDSICMVSLASRYCQGNIKGVPSSMKKTNSLTRPSLFNSHKSQLPKSVSTTTKKNVGQTPSEKKINSISALKARKLFGEEKPLKLEKVPIEASSLDVNLTAECTSVNKISIEGSSLDVSSAAESTSMNQFNLTSNTGTDTVAVGMDSCSSANVEPVEIVKLEKEILLNGREENHVDATPIKKNLSLTEQGKDIEKENNNSLDNEGGSPAISARLQELSNNLKLLYNSTPSYVETASKGDALCQTQASFDFVEPRTPDGSVRTLGKLDVTCYQSPWQTFNSCSSRAKDSLIQECLSFLNTASKEELQKLKGIGEKRATYILELREESPEPFKQLDDLQNIGLSAKQINGLMRKNMEELF